MCPVQDGKERRRQLLQAKEKMLRKEEAKEKQKLRSLNVHLMFTECSLNVPCTGAPPPTVASEREDVEWSLNVP
jgi:hypothetical protein